ncbi:uncharacterized protein JN550_005635 [Neoarthrinium moseri]|uniref:uncharacterized protein n=1 Tax=Neoarthrinium moseri TaxID=1658444 RepID=UPI001FDB4950|nr:uncharacterized protein JN550_005635 [Neoarthrinium moseri]KAI1869654.1 hypothetical protein JN550_005635 [Neoarthrinium moseri]
MTQGSMSREGPHQTRTTSHGHGSPQADIPVEESHANAASHARPDDMSRRASGTATAAGRRPSSSYGVPDSYQNLDDVFEEAPVPSPEEGRMRRRASREERYGEPQRRTSSSARRRRRSSAGGGGGGGGGYDVPDSYVNVGELFSAGPVQNPDEAALYRHESLEESRSHDQEYLKDQRQRRRASRGSISGAPPSPLQPPPAEEEKTQQGEGEGEGDAGQINVSRAATQVYTVSYLILFSIFGTLARLGLQALTSYPGAPVMFSSVWYNFAGSLVMGFLAEDRMLFRDEWGTPAYDQQIEQARRKQRDEESGGSASGEADVNLAAAKKAHLAAKKTIPLYIGLATGFCGSFTSFSSFIRDIFLALSNDLTTPGAGSTTIPRNGGYSFMALLAVILTTVSLSLAGLFIGAHLAIALEPVTPSLPFIFTRKVIDRLSVFLAFGCWIGAIVLSIVPPDRFSHGLGPAEKWRGSATFALVFAPLGCLGRFYASLHLNGRMASFPLGTFAVNMAGTVVLGMAWDLAHVPAGGVVGCQVLQGIEDGFCGCLTTVSTWVAELAALRRRHAYLYGTASVVVAVACMVAIMGGLRWTQGFSGLMCVH